MPANIISIGSAAMENGAAACPIVRDEAVKGKIACCTRPLRPELEAIIPQRMRSLPTDERGFPVPFFVEFIDGKPDFRIMNGQNFIDCVRKKLCWVCGQPLGRYMSFAAGPMCGINRTSAEPPSHRECAEFSAKACPFLTNPKMRRNEKGLPEEAGMAGIGIKRNPGVAMVWTTRSYSPFRDGKGGILFTMGEPTHVGWYAHGREATRAEVDESVISGLPLLWEVAAQQSGGLEHLEKCIRKFQKHLPR